MAKNTHTRQAVYYMTPNKETRECCMRTCHSYATQPQCHSLKMHLLYSVALIRSLVPRLSSLCEQAQNNRVKGYCVCACRGGRSWERGYSYSQMNISCTRCASNYSTHTRTFTHTCTCTCPL